jgi:hypothetical protein
MTWFKVDDGFYDHPKVKSLPRGPVRKGAIFLWNQSGSWSCKYLTDGQIPVYQIEEIGAAVKDAQALVAALLWHDSNSPCWSPKPCPLPPPGHYLFHQWPEYQPLREQVEAEKKAARERMNSRRRGKAPAEPTADVLDMFVRTGAEL